MTQAALPSAGQQKPIPIKHRQPQRLAIDVAHLEVQHFRKPQAAQVGNSSGTSNRSSFTVSIQPFELEVAFETFY